MITEDIIQATKQILRETFFDGKSDERTENEVIEQRLSELVTLMRAEAINLADKLIGPDILIHDNHKANDGSLNPVEKGIFDFQVKQRIALSVYQNPPAGLVNNPSELINAELSENEE
jgi:hypothetical protein